MSLNLSRPGLIQIMTGSDYEFRSKENEELSSRDFSEVLKINHLNPNATYHVHQVHGDRIVLVDDTSKGTPSPYGLMLGPADGLITTLKDVALVIKTADCVPLVIYDPVGEVQASLHSGWRGTLLQIGPKAIQMMQSHFGSNPKDLYATLGPSISQESFQVRDDVVTRWQKTFDFADEVIDRRDREFSYIDIKTTIVKSLQDFGMEDDKIYISDVDTFTQTAFHSYRREGKGCGLNLTITMMKSK